MYDPPKAHRVSVITNTPSGQRVIHATIGDFRREAQLNTRWPTSLRVDIQPCMIGEEFMDFLAIITLIYFCMMVVAR